MVVIYKKSGVEGYKNTIVLKYKHKIVLNANTQLCQSANTLNCCIALRRFAVDLLPPFLPLTVSQRNVNLFVNIPFTPLSIENAPFVARNYSLSSSVRAHSTKRGIWHILHTVQSAHSAHCTVHTAHCTLHITCCITHTVHFKL